MHSGALQCACINAYDSMIDTCAPPVSQQTTIIKQKDRSIRESRFQTNNDTHFYFYCVKLKSWHVVNLSCVAFHSIRNWCHFFPANMTVVYALDSWITQKMRKWKVGVRLFAWREREPNRRDLDELALFRVCNLTHGCECLDPEKCEILSKLEGREQRAESREQRAVIAGRILSAGRVMWNVAVGERRPRSEERRTEIGRGRPVCALITDAGYLRSDSPTRILNYVNHRASTYFIGVVDVYGAQSRVRRLRPTERFDSIRFDLIRFDSIPLRNAITVELWRASIKIRRRRWT